jgi:hypothetical protein
MDESAPDTFVNRGDPIPVVILHSVDDLSDEGDHHEGHVQPEGRRDRLWKRASNFSEKIRPGQGKPEAGSSMQDRLLEK